MKELQNRVIEFRDKREWAQYHNPKDLAISLSLEAAELLEIFQWKDAGEVEAGKSDEEIRRRVKEELGDILIYALTLAHEFTLNPTDIILDKLQINDKKYPAEMVKGKSDKYTAYRGKRGQAKKP
ncbi:MAG: nucleotide pyrophosphohydrolase [Desulfobacteraceae bacterium]|nr:nucleotide pyrophosphohydrolase [Desulfobacterales bacterium]MBL6968549.1 nucleotide pyrophosphohydrolase [Desulfobacteraceae bacterium]MBL7172406.1 nucleotide pyrophosphohydrolase [Desulfobacteraceae bacterium]MBU0736231.1 nucleotide pyrophosphohydrolase [Pseudomonadota bacterium]